MPRVAECGKLELNTLSNSRASLPHATHIPCGPLASRLRSFATRKQVSADGEADPLADVRRPGPGRGTPWAPETLPDCRFEGQVGEPRQGRGAKTPEYPSRALRGRLHCGPGHTVPQKTGKRLGLLVMGVPWSGQRRGCSVEQKQGAGQGGDSGEGAQGCPPCPAPHPSPSLALLPAHRSLERPSSGQRGHVEKAGTCRPQLPASSLPPGEERFTAPRRPPGLSGPAPHRFLF